MKCLMSRMMLTIALTLVWTAAQAQSVARTPVAAPIPEGLQTVEFYSPAVERNMKYDIVLPPGYENSEERYPVLYLLLGYIQNYNVWGRKRVAAFDDRTPDVQFLGS